MSINNIFLFLLLNLVSQFALAYSEDVREKVCKVPEFYKFDPPNLSEVEPGASFSLISTSNIEPETVKVLAKKIPTEVTLEDKKTFFTIKGKLPSELKGTYARIQVSADSRANCTGYDGWLLKIKGNTEPAAKKASDGKAH